MSPRNGNPGVFWWHFSRRIFFVHSMLLWRLIVKETSSKRILWLLEWFMAWFHCTKDAVQWNSVYWWKGFVDFYAVKDGNVNAFIVFLTTLVHLYSYAETELRGHAIESRSNSVLSLSMLRLVLLLHLQKKFARELPNIEITPFNFFITVNVSSLSNWS